MSVKVLIVDDSKIERMHIEGILEKYGIKADVCDDLSAAVTLLEKETYAIVFWECRIDGADMFLEKSGLENKLVFLGESKDHLSLKKPVNPNRLKACVEFMLNLDINNDVKKSANTISLQTADVDESMKIDRKTGIVNCGSEEGYMEALEIFYDTLDNRADEIEKYYNEEDIKNYTIKVHALKSSAKLVGALAFSDMAKALEEAGHNNDVDAIKTGTEELLRCYRAFKPILQPLFERETDNDDRAYMDEDDYKDTILAIAEFAEVDDYDSVEMMLDTFKEFKLNKEDSERVKKIETFLVEMKWEEIIKECRI